MITGELKNRIDSLWEVFWTGGLTNPLDVIEQMTYLMFIHDLDVSDNIHANKDSAFSKYMGDAIFKFPTPLMLSKVVDAMDDLYSQMDKLKDSDVRGDVYEYLLSKLATAGVNGQFRTPRHIIKMMVELMDPKADDVICDPSGGFRVIIMTVANSSVKSRVLKLLPKLKTEETDGLCVA